MATLTVNTPGLGKSGDDTFTGDRFDIHGIPNPTTPLTITLLNVPGNVDNDDYTYAVDFQTNSDNFTLPTPDSNSITVVDNTIAGQVHITGIPQPTDPSVFAINLYRFGVNNIGGYAKVVQLPLGTTSYTDNLDNASIPQDSPSQTNTTGKLYVDGDSNLTDVYAVNAHIGTLGDPETDITTNGIVTTTISTQPTNLNFYGIRVIPIGDGTDFTGELMLLNNRITGGSGPVFQIDQNGNIVSGTQQYPINVIDANIHVKALHPGATYAIHVDQNAGQSKFSEFIQLGQSNSFPAPAPGDGNFYLGVTNAQALFTHFPNGTTFDISGNGANVAQFGQRKCLNLIQQAGAGAGTTYLLQAFGGAHTNLPASTENTDVNFRLDRGVQFATGALTTQRAFLVNKPTYNFVGASTITTASTVSITGAPAAGTNCTITNAYALNVEAGTANFAGPVQHGGNVGFFGTAPTTQKVSGANLTNNVTAGGTTDQIDDFTNLTVYATDAAAIRNAIYQLSRKLKQVNDALRAYGLLT